MVRTEAFQTTLIGALVTDGPDAARFERNRLSYYGLQDEANIYAVWLDRDHEIRLLIVDGKGKSAQVYPCQVSIFKPR